METFEQPHTKLLYEIYDLERRGSISPQEKRKLKEMVFLNNPDILQCVSNFELSKDKVRLDSELISLSRPELSRRSSLSARSPGLTIVATKVTEDEDENSSPLGNFLRDRKKHLNIEAEHVTVVKPQPVEFSPGYEDEQGYTNSVETNFHSERAKPSQGLRIVAQRIEDPEENSSPLGNFLRDRKKRLVQEHEHHSMLKPKVVEFSPDTVESWDHTEAESPEPASRTRIDGLSIIPQRVDDDPDESSSPLGNFLRDQKRKQHLHSEHVSILKPQLIQGEFTSDNAEEDEIDQSSL